MGIDTVFIYDPQGAELNMGFATVLPIYNVNAGMQDRRTL